MSSGHSLWLRRRAKSIAEASEKDFLGFKSSVGVPKTAVHSLSFGRFTFRHPSSARAALQVSSPFREPQLANLCPKYLVHPPLAHALFNHWPTSWDPAAINVWIPPSMLVGHHYRTLDIAKTSVEDKDLQAEAPALSGRLRQRLGVPWPTYAASLFAKDYALISRAGAAERPLAEAEVNASASSTLRDFVRHVNSLRTPTLIDPPGVEDTVSS